MRVHAFGGDRSVTALAGRGSMAAGTPPTPTSSSSTRGLSVFSVAVEVFLLFVLTTMLLMMYAVRIQHDDYIRETIERARVDALDQVRRERLRELQKTIFVGLKRPADHTYNMFVSRANHFDTITVRRDVMAMRQNLASASRFGIGRILEHLASFTINVITRLFMFTDS